MLNRPQHATTSSVNLGEVAEFIRGVTFKPADVLSDEASGGIWCFRTKNVQKNLDLSDVWRVPPSVAKRKNQLVSAGDILVSNANSWNLIGKCCWIPDLGRAATFGGFVSILRTASSHADARYIYHWFSSDLVQEKVRSFGNKTTNISNLDLKRCLDLGLNLPSLPEQRRIAAILDKADALLAKRREALAKLDEMAQAIFVEMFGKGSFENSEVPLKPLGDQLSFVTSGGRNWARFYAETGHRFIRSLDVQMNKIAHEDAVFVSPPNNAETKRTRVQAGDVLLTITGSCIGRVAAVDHNFEGAHISQHVAILRPKKTVLPKYLAYYLSLPDGGQVQVNSSHYGQTKPGLNFDQIRRFQIPLPSVRAQNLFVTRLDQVDALRKRQAASSCKLQDLSSSLQHRAFSGDL